MQAEPAVFQRVNPSRRALSMSGSLTRNIPHLPNAPGNGLIRHRHQMNPRRVQTKNDFIRSKNKTEQNKEEYGHFLGFDKPKTFHDRPKNSDIIPSTVHSKNLKSTPELSIFALKE